jgi:hypothetical protein
MIILPVSKVQSACKSVDRILFVLTKEEKILLTNHPFILQNGLFRGIGVRDTRGSKNIRYF